MEKEYELVVELQHSLGVCTITFPSGTRLVSRDGGNTYRFVGFNALAVLTAKEVSERLKQGVIREVS